MSSLCASGSYKDWGYVEGEIKNLARQAKEMAG
jgi:hypothetical protein